MPPTDELLVEETLAGRLAAFDELMTRYERMVFKLAHGVVRNRQDALDVTQQVFLKAYRGLARFRRDANFRTWVMRIAYNEAVSWVRAGRAVADGGEALDALAHPGTQEQQLLAREREVLVERELEKLNARYRLAITLRYRQGMPIGEIAAVMQCSEGTTKSMLFRGVRALRDALGAAG